jgi:hypothetical protein
MVSSKNHLAHISDFMALAALAERLVTPMSLGSTPSYSAMRRLVETGPGGKIPVDTPAQRLYTCAKPAFFGLSHLRRWLADIREPTDESRLY